MQEAGISIGFKKGGTVFKDGEEYALIWFYDQWVVIPIQDEPCGMYSVEIGGECEKFAITNLLTSVEPSLDDLDEVESGDALAYDDLFNMFAGFCYAFTGVNKYNHIEMRRSESSIEQDLILESITEAWLTPALVE